MNGLYCEICHVTKKNGVHLHSFPVGGQPIMKMDVFLAKICAGLWKLQRSHGLPTSGKKDVLLER